MKINNVLNGDISLQDLLNYYNANISFVNMPIDVNGYIFCYKNIYNIYIDKELPFEQKKYVLLHELAHIELNHLNQKNKDILYLFEDKYENEVDIYINNLINNYA